MQPEAMSRIAVDDEEIDELVVELVSGDRDQKEVAEELLERSLDHDSAVQAEVVELVTDNTDYTKTTVRDWKEDLKERRSLNLIDIVDISKIIPYDPADPVMFEFEVKADEKATFRISSDDLMSSGEFEKKILELTDTHVTFDDWQGVLNNWLSQHDIDERQEEPLDVEHSVAESIMQRISSMEPTDQWDEFRSNPELVMVHMDEGEVLVSAKVIDSATREVSGELSVQKVRKLLDDMMVPGTSRKVTAWDNHSRAWRFDLERLVDGGIIEIGHLEDDDGDDGGEDGSTDDQSDDD